MARQRIALAAGAVAALALIAATAALAGGISPQDVVVAPTVAPPDGAGVAGYVFQDRDGDAIHDTGEPVLPQWPVGFYASGPLPLAEAATDADGTFQFADVQYIPAGTTTVTLRVPPVLEGPAADTMPTTSTLGQDVTAELGATIAIPVHSLRLCLDESACPPLRVPDLHPILTSDGGPDYPPSTQTLVDTTTAPGRTLLRFATSIANTGGLLHVVGVHDLDDASMQTVEQRVYGDGVVLVHRAGRFTFHAEHHHVHVDDFVRYELLSEDGQTVVRTSGKMSFCLTDIQQLTPPDPADSLSLKLPPLECGATEQGINPGFADYYGPLLPDQWIDVTGLASGNYRVRITADPDGVLLDADRANNTTDFPVALVAP